MFTAGTGFCPILVAPDGKSYGHASSNVLYVVRLKPAPAPMPTKSGSPLAARHMAIQVVQHPLGLIRESPKHGSFPRKGDFYQ